jgi:hypothetical protein
MQVLKSIPKGHKIINVVHFKPGRYPTLLELAVASATIFLFKPYYGLFENHCYWYSDVLNQILRITFLLESDDDSVNESTLAEMLLPDGMDADLFRNAIEKGSIGDLVKPSRGWKLMKVPIYWARKVIIHMVLEDYKRRLGEVKDEVRISNIFSTCYGLQGVQIEAAVEKRKRELENAEVRGQEEHRALFEREWEERRREQEEHRDREAQLQREQEEH